MKKIRSQMVQRGHCANETEAAAYRPKLQELRDNETFSDFHDLLGAMLQQGKTLEQEVVPVERLISPELQQGI